MDDEQEDVRKMTEFIKKQTSSYENNYEIEFEDFVSFKHEVTDQEFEDGLFNEDDPGFEFSSNLYKDTASSAPSAFTEEEQNTINKCADPQLQKLLVLNRSKYLQLLKLLKKTTEFLKECEEEMEDKRHALNHFERKHLNHQTFVWKLAAPYFKDRKFFPCPLNQDAIQKRARDELSFYDLTPSSKWMPIEFDRLTNAIKCNYNINRQNDIVSKMSNLKAKMSEWREDKEELASLKEQLERVKTDGKLPPLKSNEFVDWYKVAETFLKDKHTSVECQSIWHILVHPEINKSDWSDEENEKLACIARAHSYQNWDNIAAELDTNRTGFTTCLHYFSKLCAKFKKNKFSPDEDSFLLDVVNMYKMGTFIPWNKVVCHFDNRSRHQLYHRYSYFLAHPDVKRGKFSEAEDVLLMILVNRFGKNFKKCSRFMPQRSQIQLKSRYNSNLQTQIKRGAFQAEEDQIIIDYAREHGEKSWNGLKERLKRCGAQVRQRYKIIKTFLRENPKATVAEIPKRNRQYDDQQHNFLSYVVDHYKDVSYVPTLSMIEESLQYMLGHTVRSTEDSANGDSSETKLKNIDDMLTDFFSSSMEIKHCGSVITEANLNEAAESAEEILTSLGIKLHVPGDLECNAHLDNTDLEMLERISKKGDDTSQMGSSTVIPPNMSTLVGLRSLIIKHKEFKGKQKDGEPPSTSSCNSSEDVLFHQEQFSRRFYKLFHWSAILSLEKPNQSDAAGVVGTPESPASKRPNSLNHHTIVKRRKIDVSALANLKNHPRLQLVDKSLVEKLVRKSNVNVIKLEPVNCTNRSDARVATSCDGGHVDNSPHDSDEDVSDGDVRDVEKLNVILRNLKSEGNVSSPCDQQEAKS